MIIVKNPRQVLENQKGMSTIAVVLVVTAALIFLISTVAQRWAVMTSTHRKWRERVTAHLSTKHVAGIVGRAYDVGQITLTSAACGGKFYTVSGVRYCFQTTTPASSICFENPLSASAGSPGALTSPICLRDLNGTLITDATNAHKSSNIAQLKGIWPQLLPKVTLGWLGLAEAQGRPPWLPTITAVAASTISAPACVAPGPSGNCVICSPTAGNNADCALVTFCLDGTVCSPDKTYRQRLAFIR